MAGESGINVDHYKGIARTHKHAPHRPQSTWAIRSGKIAAQNRSLGTCSPTLKANEAE